MIGEAPEHATRLRASLFNSDLYIEEDLTYKDIVEANRCDAVFARHEIKSNLLALLKVPIFLQHESPLKHYASLKDGVTYMTDEAYVDYYPKAKAMPQLVLDEHFPVTSYEFDVIFIGRARVRRGFFSKLLGVLIKSEINNFGSVFDVVSSGRSAWFFAVLKVILPSRLYLKILWHCTNVIRGLRRGYIVNELRTMSQSGIRVAVVGDAAIHDQLKEYPNIHLFGVSKWSSVKSLISRSIFTVATTPLHLSIMDCRYFEALQCGSIPLVEPYPQYARLSKSDPDFFVFNYKERPLSEVMKRMLSNLTNARKTYRKIREAALLEHGKKQYIDQYESLVKQYRRHGH